MVVRSVLNRSRKNASPERVAGKAAGRSAVTDRLEDFADILEDRLVGGTRFGDGSLRRGLADDPAYPGRLDRKGSEFFFL